MFLAWALLNGLGSTSHTEEFAQELGRLAKRELSPGDYLFLTCDGQFTDEELGDEGNAFAASYFDTETGLYLRDYEQLVGEDVPTLYHVSDTWLTYDRLRPTLDDRLAAWRAGAT